MASANPHIRDRYSPLDALVMQAVRRYGEFAPNTMEGDLGLMMIEFANGVVMDVVAHPYHDGSPIRDYVSIHDARPIDDEIMISGLTMRYAAQQGSGKIDLLLPIYYRTLNQRMWHQLNGNTRIFLHRPDDRPVDRINGRYRYRLEDGVTESNGLDIRKR